MNRPMLLIAALLASTAPASTALSQTRPDRGPPVLTAANPVAQSHIDAARRAAGTRWADRLGGFCNLAMPNRPDAPPNRAQPATPVESADWPEAPAKIFDNLYFVGSKGVSAFAIDTPEGIIVTDAMWAYDVKKSVIDGLRTLGLDPARIRYVIVPHGHPDHYGGANFLHDNYGARVVLPSGDLELISQGPKYDTTPIPTSHDVLVGDGDKLTLGGTTVNFTVMPGHTPGGVVMTFPVYDHGKRHQMLIWAAGGATPGSTDGQVKQAAALKTLIARTASEHVDALADNHGSHLLVDRMRADPGQGNLFLIGEAAVGSYLTMRAECDMARSSNM